MTGFQFKIDGDRRAYRPGECLSGEVRWHLRARPRFVELRLLWRTCGRALAEVQVVETRRFEGAAAEDVATFQFTLPAQPYSFYGTLVGIEWLLEAVALPSKEHAQAFLTLSPTGRPLRLGLTPAPPATPSPIRALSP